jgi:serine/threonine protein kinase
VAARHPDMVRRLAREAHALARLTHPNVVAVYDAGLDGLDAYVVMELLAGPSLAEVLAERGALPVPLALRYGGQAAAALAAAHAIGVVHRDIKPANLVLAADGAVKVVDFGIAALRFATGRLTATGIGLGTPAYLSPEQAAGRPAEPGSDLYSLGCVLFELLTGKPAWRSAPAPGVSHSAWNRQGLPTKPRSRLTRTPATPCGSTAAPIGRSSKTTCTTWTGAPTPASTCSPQACPAHRFPSPGSNLATTMTATCSPRRCG